MAARTTPLGGDYMNIKELVAEFLGTLGLVLGGTGAAVLAADFGTGGNGTSLGLGFVGVSLAFGLTVVTGAYACLLYTSPSPRDLSTSRMPSSA